MGKLRRAHIWIAAVAAASAICGCTSFSKGAKAGVDTPQQNTRVQREGMLQTAWRGRPYHDLIGAFGAPHAILETPRREQIKTDIVLYGINDQVSRCIDAFVVVDDDVDDPIVKDYFCR